MRKEIGVGLADQEKPSNTGTDQTRPEIRNKIRNEKGNQEKRVGLADQEEPSPNGTDQTRPEIRKKIRNKKGNQEIGVGLGGAVSHWN